MKKRYFLSKVILVGAAALALAACGGGDDEPELTVAKYQAIKKGMTIEQVNGIVGMPATKVNDPIPDPEGTVRVHEWINGNDVLLVVFLNQITAKYKLLNLGATILDEQY